MRYDTEVHFIRKSEKDRYDAETGEWVSNDPTVTTTEANVTDLGTESSIKVFGDIKQGAKVIRTQPLFVIPEWDTVKINEVSYKLLTSRIPLCRNSLVVQEVMPNG